MADNLISSHVLPKPKHACNGCGQPATRFRKDHGQTICDADRATAMLCEACFKVGSGMAMVAFAAKLLGAW